MPWCCSCFAKTYEAPEVLELDYRHSSLSEVPPDVFTYERTLEKLDLGCNQISDLPPSLFHCHELRELDLCDNDLMTIPPAIGSLTRLIRLDLSRNAIADIADTIKNCKNLTYLDLSLNHLQKLPEGISQLVNLEELFLNDTYLEFLNANFGRLTKLKVLELRENSLQTLPKSMNRLHNLQRIDIGQNDISELPEVIGTMTNLIEIWCDNNSIRVIPKIIGNLTKLNCLDASQNEIQEISEDISKCTQLSDLTLANNSLENLPDSFPKLENLTVLRLDSNSIQYLPEDFGNLKSLQELSLIRNLLKSLPVSVGLMRKLRTLYLDDNLLTELPKEIGSCSALSILSVAKNRLTTIPSEVGHLNNLKVLTVAGNLLVNLPVSIFNIRELDALWLSESQSKPLLPLTKEVDLNTGQHVLTCYLLPQLPSQQMELQTIPEDSSPPRRSRPSIKFVTDAEPQPTENNISKRGLLRAPTPYPKELRALAKHASHLRSKDQNGDVIINDEPEYEGDYAEQDLQPEGTTGNKYGLKMLHNGGILYQQQHQYQQVPALPVKDYSDREMETDSRRNYEGFHASSAIPGPQTPLLPSTVERILSNIEEANKRSQDNALHYPPQTTTTNISLIDPCPVVSEASAYTSSNGDDTKKGPPPYHVAAMRAAMFRSTQPSSPSVPPLGLPVGESQNTNSAKSNRTESEFQQSLADTASNVPPALPDATSIIPANVQNAAGGTIDDHSIASDQDTVDAPRNSNATDMRWWGRGDGTWNGVEYKSEQCTAIVSKESRVIEEIIESSNAHNQLQRKSTQESVSQSKEETAVYSNIETIVQHQHTNNFAVAREDKVVSDLISTIEMSLRNDKDDDGQVSTGQQLENVALNGANSKQWKPAGVSDDSFSSSRSTSDNNNVSDIGIKAEYYMAQQQQDCGSTFTRSSAASSLSSSESFSKIPKFSTPSKPTAATTGSAVDYNKVPPNNNAVTANKSAINSYNSNSSITSISGNSPGSSTNWSKIPKIPTKSSVSGTELKKPETGPKPSLIRTSSGSRIPAANTDSLRANKSVPIRSVNTGLTSPTGVSSRIPRFGDQSFQNNQSYKQDEQAAESYEKPEHAVQHNHVGQSQSYHHHHGQQPHSEPPKLERTHSGSRIPKFGDQSRHSNEADQPQKARLIEATVPVQTSSEPSNSVTPTGVSKIPTVGGRKPWIFGTHRNARVVPVEYTKVNSLGFTVTNGPVVPSASEGGIYIDSVEDADSSVKVGDKILQVDGIDVSNMGLEIVRKILSNCQENIHLLVSRHY